MKIQILLSAIVLTSSVADSSTSCVESQESAARTIATSAGEFSSKFTNFLAKAHPGNLISSPFGAYALLSMISLGARGSTEELFKSALNQPCDKNLFNRGFQELTDHFNQSSGVKLMLGSKAFVSNKHELQENFRQSTKTIFRSESQSLDFNKANDAAEAVNSWVASATENHITELFKSEELADANLALVNVIWFKSKWEKEFDRDVDRFKSFYVDEKTEKQVEMMHARDTFYTGELPSLNARFLKLFYDKGDSENQFSMIIIVPVPVNGIQKVIENLHTVDFKQNIGNKMYVDVYLPKFKITSDLDLKSILQEMNMTEIFSSTANFEGILEGNIGISISGIKQKAIIEVNEEGSEASAATGAVFAPTSYTPEFAANRPFFFAIRDENSGAQLFHGIVFDPTIAV